MRFDWSSCAVGVIGGVGAILCVIFAVQLDVFVDTPICTDDENGLTCARGWVNAVGVVAAAGSIFFLYRQLREQMKQSAFLLGDARPTFDVYAEGRPIVFFRIVNWNRRTLVVDSIHCEQLTLLTIHSAKLEHATDAIQLPDDRAEFAIPIRVASYDDRSKAPAILRLEGIPFARTDAKEISATFKLRGRLLGEDHQFVELVARGVVIQLTR